MCDRLIRCLNQNRIKVNILRTPPFVSRPTSVVSVLKRPLDSAWQSSLMSSYYSDTDANIENYVELVCCCFVAFLPYTGVRLASVRHTASVCGSARDSVSHSRSLVTHCCVRMVSIQTTQTYFKMSHDVTDHTFETAVEHPDVQKEELTVKKSKDWNETTRHELCEDLEAALLIIIQFCLHVHTITNTSSPAIHTHAHTHSDMHLHSQTTQFSLKTNIHMHVHSMHIYTNTQ